MRAYILESMENEQIEIKKKGQARCHKYQT